jgi:hypothetical protein
MQPEEPAPVQQPSYSRYDASYTPVIEPFAQTEPSPGLGAPRLGRSGDTELPSFINTGRTPSVRTSPFQSQPAQQQTFPNQSGLGQQSGPQPGQDPAEENRGFTPDVPAYLRRAPKK